MEVDDKELKKMEEEEKAIDKEIARAKEQRNYLLMQLTSTLQKNIKRKRELRDCLTLRNTVLRRRLEELKTIEQSVDTTIDAIELREEEKELIFNETTIEQQLQPSTSRNMIVIDKVDVIELQEKEKKPITNETMVRQQSQLSTSSNVIVIDKVDVIELQGKEKEPITNETMVGQQSQLSTSNNVITIDEERDHNPNITADEEFHGNLIVHDKCNSDEWDATIKIKQDPELNDSERCQTLTIQDNTIQTVTIQDTLQDEIQATTTETCETYQQFISHQNIDRSKRVSWIIRPQKIEQQRNITNYSDRETERKTTKTCNNGKIKGNASSQSKAVKKTNNISYPIPIQIQTLQFGESRKKKKKKKKKNKSKKPLELQQCAKVGNGIEEMQKVSLCTPSIPFQPFPFQQKPTEWKQRTQQNFIPFHTFQQKQMEWKQPTQPNFTEDAIPPTSLNISIY